MIIAGSQGHYQETRRAEPKTFLLLGGGGHLDKNKFQNDPIARDINRIKKKYIYDNTVKNTIMLK